MGRRIRGCPTRGRSLRGDASIFHDCINFTQNVRCGVMRTTVTLSDEAAELVNQYAESARVSRSRAVSELVVRGGRTKSRIKLVNGIPVLDIPGGRRVTTEEVKRFEAEEL